MLSLEELIEISTVCIGIPALVWVSYKTLQSSEMTKINILLEKYKLDPDASTIFYGDTKFIRELSNMKVRFAKAYKTDVLSRCAKTTPIYFIPR